MTRTKRVKLNAPVDPDPVPEVQAEEDEEEFYEEEFDEEDEGKDEEPNDGIVDDNLNPRVKNKSKEDKWTQITKEFFLTNAYMKKLHLNEHGIKKDDKLALVFADCMASSAFRDFEKDKKITAFKQVFHRWMNEFKIRTGIDDQGANLSGLKPATEAGLSTIDRILYDMCREQKKVGQEALNAIAKNKRTQQRMLTYERQGIQKQTHPGIG